MRLGNFRFLQRKLEIDEPNGHHNVIENFANLLPPIRIVKLRCESDYYGASYLIGEKLGFTTPPQSNAEWQHGWPYGPINHFRQISNSQVRGLRLVATEEHAKILRGAGMKAIATGMPFLHTQQPITKRIPSSLLIMPAHVTKHSKHSVNEMEYVDSICSIRNRFSLVVACISQQCIDKGYWTKSFDSVGIQWIAGAGAHDANALRRMRSLFSYFDVMTSNTLGSHFVYAAYSGCRPSLFGPIHKYSQSDFEHEPLYRKYPELLPLALQRTSAESIQKYYPHLFCEPQDSQLSADWACRELGGEHIKSPAEMSRLLGWGASKQATLRARRAVLIICDRVKRLARKSREP